MMKKTMYLLSIFVFLVACSSSKVEQSTVEKPEEKEKVNFNVDDFYQFDSRLSQEGLAATDVKPPSLDIPGQIIWACLKEKNEDGVNLAKAYYKGLKSKAAFWNARAICDEMRGNHLLSDIAWRKSLKLDPKFSASYVNLGISMARQNKMEKALAFFKKAQESGRFSALPLYNMAILYLENGLAEKALTILKGLESSQNRNEGLIGALGVSSLVVGDVDSAIKYLSSLPVEKLRRPSWGLNYAFALYLKGEYETSKKILGLSSWNDDDEASKYYQNIMFLLGKKI